MFTLFSVQIPGLLTVPYPVLKAADLLDVKGWCGGWDGNGTRCSGCLRALQFSTSLSLQPHLSSMTESIGEPSLRSCVVPYPLL